MIITPERLMINRNILLLSKVKQPEQINKHPFPEQQELLAGSQKSLANINKAFISFKSNMMNEPDFAQLKAKSRSLSNEFLYVDIENTSYLMDISL